MRWADTTSTNMETAMPGHRAPGVLRLDDSKEQIALTDKMQMFVSEYVLDFNPVRAAKEAGYKNSSMAGARLLKDRRVQRVINRLVKPMLDEARLNQKEIYNQLARFTFYNIAQYYDEEGNLTLSPSELPEEIQQCITSIQSDHRYDKEGNIISTKMKISLVDKVASLRMVMEAMKFLVQEHHHTFDWAGLYEAMEKQQPPTIEGEFKRISLEMTNAETS